MRYRLKTPHRLPSQIHHVDIGSEPDVIGEVPPDVIRIIVDDDVVRIPEPAVTVANVVGSHVEVETAEPKAAGASASEAPHVAATETAGEAAMFPRMVQMIVSVVAAGVMAHPLSIAMHVGSCGMSFLVVELAVFLGRMWSSYFRRAVLGNVLMATTNFRPSTAALMSAMLCHG